MDFNKKIGIVIAIIAIICVIVVGFFLMNSSEEYERVNVTATCSMELPVSNKTNYTYDSEHDVYTYENEEKGFKIVGGNSEDWGMADSTYFSALEISYMTGTEKAEYNGTTYVKNSEGYYVIDTGNGGYDVGADWGTHDNIIIMAKSVEMLDRIYKSIKYTNQTNINQTNTNETVSDSNTVTANSEPSNVCRICGGAIGDGRYLGEVYCPSCNKEYYDSESSYSYEKQMGAAENYYNGVYCEKCGSYGCSHVN